ncbi:hypothetical protein HKX48_005051 [Thoreauomyces humboldtii]|nr:hypothetical protein HKX48_005051 [Thoreauomyces humboldtii]
MNLDGSSRFDPSVKDTSGFKESEPSGRAERVRQHAEDAVARRNRLGMQDAKSHLNPQNVQDPFVRLKGSGTDPAARDPDNIRNSLVFSKEPVRYDSRKVRTDIGAMPRTDPYHNSVNEYLQTTESRGESDPTFLHFGRPGGGAPLLNPVTHQIDTHRGGLRRSQKFAQGYNERLAMEEAKLAEQRRAAEQRTGRRPKGNEGFQNDPDPWRWGSDAPLRQGDFRHRATDVFDDAKHFDPAASTAYHADLDWLVRHRQKNATRLKQEDTDLGIKHIESSLNPWIHDQTTYGVPPTRYHQADSEAGHVIFAKPKLLGAPQLYDISNSRGDHRLF